MKKSLFRESLIRTRSERIVDRYLIDTLDTQANTVKKQKLDDESASEKPRVVRSYEALAKLKVHLAGPEKFAKSLSLVMKLLKKHYQKISIEEVFDCLDIIVSSGNVNSPPHELVRELFRFVHEIYHHRFSPEQERLFDKWMFLADKLNSLFTDDSFAFHMNLRFFSSFLMGLPSPADPDPMSWHSLFIRSLQIIVQFLKLPWAKTAVQQLLVETYRVSDKFTEEQQDVILELCKGRSSAQEARLPATRNILDSPRVITDSPFNFQLP